MEDVDLEDQTPEAAKIIKAERNTPWLKVDLPELDYHSALTVQVGVLFFVLIMLVTQQMLVGGTAGHLSVSPAI